MISVKQSRASNTVTGRTPARILFLGSGYAGHRTRFLNLKAHTESDPRVLASYREVSGWQPNGWIESLPAVPTVIKGRLRAVLQSSAMATIPRPDAIWTGIKEVAMPFLWSQAGPLRRPMVLDMDCTVAQLEEMAPAYFHRPAKRGPRLALALLLERLLWSRTTLFTPWSNWAANDLRHRGISDDRILVLPPGVDLDEWRPRPELARPPSERLRLLFVGGNFVRKGGDLLLDVFSRHFADQCQLDIVTRDRVEPRPNVTVHRAEPNSPLLHQLYASADLFVLPTRAECFGIATIEAMASGIPVIMGNVGGAKDIVQDGSTGWLIEPSPSALVAALRHAVANHQILRRMGQMGRLDAQARFDGARNDADILDLLLAQTSSRH